MSNEAIPVITISRKYSAGGRSVAKALSERLDIPWYDKDFVTKIAGESGYSEEDIANEGEEITGGQRVLDAILNSNVAYNSSRDEIFNAQKEAMLDLAKSPCIIVGRCGNVVLKEAGVKVFSIFLHGDANIRIKRTMERDDLSETEAKKMMEKRDSNRANYYKKYTGHRMDCADDYTVSLDTTSLNYEQCADILVELIRNF